MSLLTKQKYLLESKFIAPYVDIILEKLPRNWHLINSLILIVEKVPFNSERIDLILGNNLSSFDDKQTVLTALKNLSLIYQDEAFLEGKRLEEHFIKTCPSGNNCFTAIRWIREVAKDITLSLINESFIYYPKEHINKYSEEIEIKLKEVTKTIFAGIGVEIKVNFVTELKVLGKIPNRINRFSENPHDNVNFSSLYLPEINFGGSYFHQLSFIGTNLSKGKFILAALNDCDFVKANLCGTNFNGASLFRCNFRGADLTGASFIGTKIYYLRKHYDNVRQCWKEKVSGRQISDPKKIKQYLIYAGAHNVDKAYFTELDKENRDRMINCPPPGLRASFFESTSFSVAGSQGYPTPKP